MKGFRGALEPILEELLGGRRMFRASRARVKVTNEGLNFLLLEREMQAPEQRSLGIREQLLEAFHLFSAPQIAAPKPPYFCGI